MEGRVVGVAVHVRGGFMFFSSDPDLKGLEATVFRRVKMISQRVVEIIDANRISKGESATKAPHNWTAAAIDPRGDNVVRLHARRWDTNGDPEPPDAA